MSSLTGPAPGPAGPLDGLRVLELATGIAGPVAGMVLADFGADVVKAEPPEGDPARSLPGFAVWNRGKRSIVADPGGLAALAAEADVVVCSRRPDLPVDGPIVVEVTPYTDTTPWAGGRESAGLLAAATGIAFRQSSWDDVPVDSVYPHVLYAQGLWAGTVAVAAVLERERTGSVRHAQVAGVHGALITSVGTLVAHPRVSIGHRPGGAGGPTAFYRPYRCGDGQWLFLASLTPEFYMRAFDLLGVMDIFTDERVSGEAFNLLRPDNIPWVLERFSAVFATRPRDEWLTLLAGAGVPAGPLLDRRDWLDHPQLDAIGMRVEMDDPERGKVVMPGVHLNLTASPGRVRGPAPPLGSAETGSGAGALEAVGWGGRTVDRRERDRQAWAPAGGRGPLQGVRVVDLGAIIAGPYAATLLAELGAEVVKVEPPNGDSFRGPGAGSGFQAYNRGQRGVVLDLRSPAGRDGLLALVARADAVVDNYRPGVLERLGLTYDDLVRANPAVVTMSITGFGEGGPLSAQAGFDPILQAMSGMMLAQGGDDDPVFFTMPVNDIASGVTGALGVCLALLHRERTGAGQRTWTSLAGASAFMQSGELVRYPGRTEATIGGRDFPGPSDSDRFLPTGDGWVRVDGAVAASELASMDRDRALQELRARGVPAVPARRPDELRDAPDLAAYGFLETRSPDHQAPGRVVRFDPPSDPGPMLAPGLGEHTVEVLAEVGVAAGPSALA